jgi:hypothetical protein
MKKMNRTIIIVVAENPPNCCRIPLPHPQTQSSGNTDEKEKQDQTDTGKGKQKTRTGTKRVGRKLRNTIREGDLMRMT